MIPAVMITRCYRLPPIPTCDGGLDGFGWLMPAEALVPEWDGKDPARLTYLTVRRRLVREGARLLNEVGESFWYKNHTLSDNGRPCFHHIGLPDEVVNGVQERDRALAPWKNG